MNIVKRNQGKTVDGDQGRNKGSERGEELDNSRLSWILKKETALCVSFEFEFTTE